MRHRFDSGSPAGFAGVFRAIAVRGGRLVLAAGIALLAACDGEAPKAAVDAGAAGAASAPPFPKTLQLNWVAEPEFGGFFAAADLGLFAKEGLDLKLVQGSADVPAPQLVASGKVELAVVAATQLVELNDAGGDLVAIYAVFQTNPMGVMVHEASPYQTLTELWESPDATLAIQDGLADFAYLSRNFPGGKLRMVPYTGSLGQFAVDPKLASQCFIPSEPAALALKGVKTRVFQIAEAGFNPYNAVVATTRSFLAKHPRECAAFVRAAAAGWRRYLDDPAPFNATMAKLNPAMTPEAMALCAKDQQPLIENDETKRIGLGGMRLPRWEETVKQLVDLGRVKQAADAGRLFHWDMSADTAR
jgi:NitT/TauT family transport system substrate-binding protein